VAVTGLALVVAAPVGPVLDVAGGTQRGRQLGPQRGDGRPLHRRRISAAVTAIGPRWWAWCQGLAGVGGAAAAAQAIRNARAIRCPTFDRRP
jgi:hypothetical protein